MPGADHATTSVPAPTPRQLRWQQAGFGLFLHFGINTFHGKEWSDGTLDPRAFDPAELDAVQWVETARAAGAAYVVLTAKHHDGFCLWPTDTTDYSVRSAPWRGGRGDVVAELAEACRRAGIGLGLYLSPWDRNAACYDDPDPAAYDAFYLRQLTELCTRYGPLVELWFDGAGSEGRTYDWDAVMAVIDRHQPEAMVFNMGRPTIRWVGNEDGLAADPVHYAASSSRLSVYAHEDTALDAPAYLPPECDVPIRSHWFWQPDDLDTLKSREHLLGIWYRSVGLGAGLLLNLPPDRRGLIDPVDRARLLETTDELARRFARPYPAELTELTELTGSGTEYRARFPAPVTIDHLELREELTAGQHITWHRILADGRPLVSAGTVGVRRIHAFEPVTVTELTIRLTGAMDGAGLCAVTGFRTGHSRLPELEPQSGMLAGKIDHEPERTA
ncbi:alpha-L-fucosidase [Streptacidiphilus pinicola]|uniref:alpha-L-fucosidase n=1 Tax=Streptacidiphilus pinicola TaxID=2219663 RepID=A0A2X0IUR0_9ACTN|nr:alpha-L-fucosidase [Streptacidiphilus pinicola]RAG81316.1 alpha-L-fucosidase [Streptacidiphilus pinicola]